MVSVMLQEIKCRGFKFLFFFFVSVCVCYRHYWNDSSSSCGSGTLNGRIEVFSACFVARFGRRKEKKNLWSVFFPLLRSLRVRRKEGARVDQTGP